MLLIAAVVLLGLAALGGFLSDNSSEDSSLQDNAAESDDEPSDERSDEAAATDEDPTLHADMLAFRAEDDPRALGDPDAAVVMIQWADFQCGFCARFARETEPELIERYVDPGILRIEWRDLPLQGDAAVQTAFAGRAAADQEAFWQLHEALYAEESPLPSSQRNRDGLADLAEHLDLDVDRFLDIYDDPDVRQAVAAEAQLAQQLGITGTPAFLIADQPVMGAQPFEVFASVIEAAAQDAGVALP